MSYGGYTLLGTLSVSTEFSTFSHSTKIMIGWCTQMSQVCENLEQVVLKVTETIQYAIYIHPSALTRMIVVYIHNVHSCVYATCIFSLMESEPATLIPVQHSFICLP